MTTLAEVLADLEWIEKRWPDLYEARKHGTPLPWREPELTREQRAERDHLARQERLQADDDMPGHSRAPLRVDVVDLLRDVLLKADMLHGTIADTAKNKRLPVAESAGDDPRRFIAFARHLLAKAVEADPPLLSRVGFWAASLKERIRATLGEIEDGHRLKAVCPFCLGRTDEQPIGGEHTLRIREIPYPTQGPDATEFVVVCEGGHCTPFAAEVTLWVQGKPAWRQPEWDWLATRLAEVNDQIKESAA